MLPISRLEQILERASRARVLVAGDVMLDEFVWGRVGRISPEAPVPVVEVERETEYAGGAANVVRNLRGFASNVAVMGVVGTDAAAQRVCDLLRNDGIDVSAVQSCANRPTTVKTRIIARHQQIVRVDREQCAPPSEQVRSAALDQLAGMLPTTDALILSDYGKGFLSPEFALALCAEATAAAKCVTADPNPNNPVPWNSVTAVKPNRAEAFRAAGMDHRVSDPVALDDVAEELLRQWNTEMLLITLGEEGMLLAQRDGTRYHTPSRAREVFDVSGAGDTAMALFTLALAAQAAPWEAAEIANHASSVVVGKLGTATLTPAELIASFRDAGHG